MLAATDADADLRAGLLRRDRELAGAPYRAAPSRSRRHRRSKPCSRRNRIGELRHAQLENRSWQPPSRSPRSSPAVVIPRHDAVRLIGDTAGAATPAAADRTAMPVPVADDRQEDDPDLSRVFGAHRGDPQRHAAGQGRRAISRSSTSPDGTDVKAGRPSLQDRSARLSGRARPGQGAGAARRGRARLCARAISTAATSSPRAAISPRTPSTSAPAPSRQAEAALAMTEAAVRTAELNLELHGDPRALRRPARPQPGAGRHADQRRRHAAQHAGAARPDLCHLQSERDGSCRDPEGARRGQGRGRGAAARRDATARTTAS